MKATTEPSQNRERLIDQVERQIELLTQHGQEHFERRLRPYSLTVPQYLALHTIVRLGPHVTMTAIGDAIQAPPSSMTSIVGRLVSLGLAERDRLPDDRRAVVASVTEAGCQIVQTIEALRHQDLIAMLDGMPDETVASFVTILLRA